MAVWFCSILVFISFSVKGRNATFKGSLEQAEFIKWSTDSEMNHTLLHMDFSLTYRRVIIIYLCSRTLQQRCLLHILYSFYRQNLHMISKPRSYNICNKLQCKAVMRMQPPEQVLGHLICFRALSKCLNKCLNFQSFWADLICLKSWETAEWSCCTEIDKDEKKR